MSKLVGIVALGVASALLVAAPAVAAPEEPDATEPTVEVETDEAATTDSTESTTTTAPALSPIEASEGQTPTRGEQVQLVDPPPPPPPPEWVLPANSGEGRRVVYSKSIQRVWAVDANGVVAKTHKVSGRQTPLDPRPGTYSVWSRSLHTFAIQNPTITWKYMVRFAHGGQGGNIGFHEIPFQYGRPVQSISQLGQPLSGGCVRQATPDAIWMWNWAQLGTTVVVLP
ncbi:MAG: L,D-transpeptidase [Actinomycetota bacterium]